MTKRRPSKEVELVPTYESDADNKFTFCPRTEDEFTILFRVPVGRENRKKTAKLMPFMKHFGVFMTDKGEVDPKQMMDFFSVIEDIWQEGEFDDEMFPFAIGLEPDDPRLEKVGLGEAFMSFIKAFGFIAGGFNQEEVELAQKKSKD